MTRNEEIKQAAQEMGLWQAGEALFQFGAEWADSHPQKGKVDIGAVLNWLASHINDYIVNGRDIDYMFSDLCKAMEG